jgi:S-DNA-T family DNA segregation ATPase FtsK/SpoIIIE
MAMTRFSRFARDILGVCLLVLALLTILALTGISEGVILSAYARFLHIWLGGGSWAIIPICGGLSAWALNRQYPTMRISLSRILAIEGTFFTALALVSVIGGHSLARAEAGLDGGLVGWGLAELPVALGLAPWIRDGLLAVFLFLFIFGSVDFLGPLERRINRMLPDPAVGEAAGADPPVIFSNPAVEPDALPIVEPGRGDQSQKKKAATKLPPEFRKSLRVQAATPELSPPPPRDERLPPLNLLVGEQSVRPDERHINLTAGLIEKTLAEFGIPAKVIGFRIGPTVTQFAVEPGYTEKPAPDGSLLRQKVRVSQISALNRDLTLALSAERLRIEAPVPGRSYVGIEVPNARSTVVRLRPILEMEAFYKLNSPLGIALGRDVSGGAVVADLARMPHMLIAGTTGSGKSVCVTAITACLVVNNPPTDLRLAMIDPKMVELVRFNGLPHLLGKVETNLERILGVLRWTLGEMDHRYRLLENARARDLDSYNRKMEKRKQPTLPRIVLIIDELADLMMSAPDQTEHSLVRLAQMARATGIHLVVATQRPSTDVVTGLIKANFPARIAFTVASSIDSRVILDTPGAETLLGRGDMLFLNPEVGTPQRAQGVMITDQEVERVITFWQKMSPSGDTGAAPWEELLNQSDDGSDALIQQAIAVVRGSKRASASLLQRRLRVGYPRAARLIDELEDLGVVGPSQGGGRDREVLIEADDEEEDEVDGSA